MIFRIVGIIVLLATSSLFTLKAQETNPSFGAGLRLLVSEGNTNQNIGRLELTASSEFAVANTGELLADGETVRQSLHLWTIPTEVDEVLSITANNSFQYHPSAGISSIPFDVSPANARIVIPGMPEIQVLSLPDFEVVASLTINRQSTRLVQWSAAGDYIGIVTDADTEALFTVWNPVTSTTMTHRLIGFVPYRIIAVEHGWILLPASFVRAGNIAYIHCDLVLTDCIPTINEGGSRGPVAISGNGERIISEIRNDNDEYQIMAWEFSEGIYQASLGPVIGIDRIVNLSSDGNYAHSTAEIWETQNWRPLGETRRFDGLFHPDDNRLVIFDGRRMYVYQAETASLISETDISEFLDMDLSQYFYEDMRLAGISSDGQWAELILGTGAALIALPD